MRAPFLGDIARTQTDRRLRDAEAAALLGASRRPGRWGRLSRLLSVVRLQRSPSSPARMPVVVGDPAYRA